LLCKKRNKGPHYHPRYDTEEYKTPEECKNACLTLVPNCDAVNFHAKDKKCGFEQCNGKFKFGGTKGSYVYVFVVGRDTTAATTTIPGKQTSQAPQRLTTPAIVVTTPKSPTVFGWQKVRDSSQTKLKCLKKNHGKDANGKIPTPRYDSKFSTVEECQNACVNLVPDCDAVNYDKEKGGKCGFEQCNGKLAFGGTKGYDSYIYVAPPSTTAGTGTTTTATKQSTTSQPVPTTPSPITTTDQKTTATDQAPKTTITTIPAPTSAVVSSSKTTTVLDVKPVLTMDSKTKITPGALTTAPRTSATVQNLRLTTAGMRANVRNKVRNVFRDRAAAATKLRQNYGLDKILEISVVSDLSDSDDGKRVIQSVTLKGYSLTTFTKTARTNFCSFVTNQAGFSAGLCEILTVTSVAGSSPPAAGGSGRRILQESAAITVKFAVWYNAQDAGNKSANYGNTGQDSSGGGTNVTVVAVVVVVILVLVAALAVGLVLYFMRSRTNNPVVPQSFTNLYAPTPSTGDDFSFDDNSNQLADGTLSVDEQEDKFSVATF